DRKDGGHLGGCLSEAKQFLPLMLDEALPLDQILGRIAADQLLLENSDRGLLLRHLMRKLERSIHVVGQRAHGGVDVGESYFDQAHGCLTLTVGASGGNCAQSTDSRTERTGGLEERNEAAMVRAMTQFASDLEVLKPQESWYQRLYRRVEGLSATPYALAAFLIVSVI